MKKFFLKILGLIALALIICGTYFYHKFEPAADPEWGITFSYQAASALGLNEQYAFADMLADLKPKKIRLMTYWEDIEKNRGEYDFSRVDWQIGLAERSNVEVLMVLGRKQPRWPECHEPEWFKSLSASDQDQAVLNFVRETVRHFKTSSAITHWQVENEPFFVFGPECPKLSEELLSQEIALVRQEDPDRKIVTTDSGDRGGWISAGSAGTDILGVTLYRVSYDEKYGGYYKYPLPPAFYRIRSGLFSTITSVNEVWDVELQMEPWFPSGPENTPIDQQKTLMNQKVFADNIAYAKEIGFGRHYLWGVEWWYWMAQVHGDWGMWTTAKELLNSD